MSRKFVRATVALGLALALVNACHDGGDDDDGGVIVAGQPVLRSITASGVAMPLWELVNGTPVQPSPCPPGVALNTTITFAFEGPVDPASVPSGGLALGSINISATILASTVPAQGTFSVEDDPLLPPGNRRRVVFRPTPPSSPTNPSVGGLASASSYTIFVPRGGGGPQVLTVAGMPISGEALTCFDTCNAQTPGLQCFADYQPGPPFLASTTPASGDPAPAPLTSAAAGNRVSLVFNEPLQPANINANTVRLVAASGAQVPGGVVFFQAGTPEAGPSGSRIDYIASAPLLPGTTYEILVSPLVQDFGGNAAVLYDPNAAPASGRRFLAIATEPFCDHAPIVEEFDTTTTRASTAGVAQWIGNGQVVATFPAELVGDGSFGVLTFPVGPSSLDPGMPGVAGLMNGVWNTTQVTVPAGATVRCTGHASGNLWRIHLRCLGNVDISGALNASAGINTSAPINDPEQGPRSGSFNNGVNALPAAPAWVAGGVGGSGGGRGGHASQTDMVGPQTRTSRGEAGFGPPVGGQANAGPYGANALYGGGDGGYGGFNFPVGGIPGEPGGLGGAGGSSLLSGGNGGPNTALPTCTPVPTVSSQVRALATLPPTAMLPPISVQSAGSGGGGGGDHFDISGVNLDDQGGGGGGGGGGIRISAVGTISVNAGAVINLNGAFGGNGSIFMAGFGGGGSGGELWLQSFSVLSIAPAANMTVNGGVPGQTCGNFAAGRGGAGLYQFEDADGIVSTTFAGQPAGLPGGVSAVTVVQFPFSTNITGRATSTFFDTGYGAPDFTAATSVIQLGNASGAMLDVSFQGAFEAVSGGVPDLATLSPAVSAANLDALDGRRYIRIVVDIAYASPPATNPANIFPSLDRVTIAYRTPCGSP